MCQEELALASGEKRLLLVPPNTFPSILLKWVTPSPGGSFILKHPCSYLEYLFSAHTNPTHLPESIQPRPHLLRWVFPHHHCPKSCLSIYFLQLATVQNNYLTQIISSLPGNFLCICFLNLPIDYTLWPRSTPGILHSFQHKYYWAHNRNPGFCVARFPTPCKPQVRFRWAERSRGWEAVFSVLCYFLLTPSCQEKSSCPQLFWNGAKRASRFWKHVTWEKDQLASGNPWLSLFPAAPPHLVKCNRLL